MCNPVVTFSYFYQHHYISPPFETECIKGREDMHVLLDCSRHERRYSQETGAKTLAPQPHHSRCIHGAVRVAATTALRRHSTQGSSFLLQAATTAIYSAFRTSALVVPRYHPKLCSIQKRPTIPVVRIMPAPLAKGAYELCSPLMHVSVV